MSVPYNQQIRTRGGSFVGLLATFVVSALPLRGETLYDFGNPTGDEQLYLELINRARANPPAEGVRLATTTDANVLAAYSQFGVDLSMLQSEFNAIAALPPLAPNAALTSAARSHSAWMLANDIQSHNETNPSNTPFTRMTAAGYNYNSAGENVFAYAKSIWYGHAGFEVDWGSGPGGMQDPRGHRANIHNSTFREIGVGVVLGSNTNVGPQLVTQDFGYRSASPSFGTGVAYYDLNGNNFYDVGEGISGLTVNVSGASYYCNTATGGGWAIPVPSASTTRSVTFSGLGVNQSTNVAFTSSQNAKADLKLTYNPPTITSSATAYSGVSYPLTFTTVAGATSYKWKRWNLAAAAPENCESTAGITTSTTGNYSVRNTNVKQQGTSSFHLECTNGTNQSIELNGLYYGQASSALSFQSRIRYATTTQTFKVQVREDASSTWQDVFSQAGTNSDSEGSFNLRSASLTSMAGKAFHVRFLLNHAGSYYTTSGDIVGWFIDAISFSNTSGLANLNSQVLAGTSGSFTPTTNTYLMSVSPVISNTDYPASYLTLTVTDPPPAPEPTFATWAADMENSNSLPAGTLSDPNADYDHDGRSNLIEYAFGTSPVSGGDSASLLPAAHATDTEFILEYQRDTSLTDLTYTPQACSALGNWKSLGAPDAPAGFVDQLVSTNGSIETRQAKIPRTSAAYFLRIKVSRP